MIIQMAEKAKRMLEENASWVAISRYLVLSKSTICNLIKEMLNSGDDYIKNIEN